MGDAMLAYDYCLQHINNWDTTTAAKRQPSTKYTLIIKAILKQLLLTTIIVHIHLLYTQKGEYTFTHHTYIHTYRVLAPPCGCSYQDLFTE